MRTQAAWKVDTHIFSATGPTSDADAVLHLVGGLVGERDGEDLERADAVLADEVGDAVGEHPRLARTGPGDDEQRAVHVGDGIALDGVQALEEIVTGRGHGPPRLPGPCDRSGGAAAIEAPTEHPTWLGLG